MVKGARTRAQRQEEEAAALFAEGGRHRDRGE